jgi:oligoribonuclease NrnB/cAMP/cGMP phosphodiesterase (DHH superfamily)
MPQRAIVISHGPCLDGAASAVCVARAYGPANVTAWFTHPSEIDALLRDLRLDEAPAADVWITDIGWKTEESETLLVKLADRGTRVFWIDHHSNALTRAERGLDGLRLAGHRITREFSAAKLTYDYLVEHAPSGNALSLLKAFEKIVLMADDADRWIHRIPGSRELARALGALTSAEAYDELLRIGPTGEYPETLTRALAASEAQLAKSIDLAMATRARRPMGDGVTLVACLCDGYVSEVAEHLRQQESTAVFVIYNTENRRISLRRSNDTEIDCATLAGAFGGGGHPAAAGFDLPHLDQLIVSEVTERTAGALADLLQRARPTSSS